MILYFFFVFGVYFSLVIALIVGWQMLMGQSIIKTSTIDKKKISVIVPYRNEEANLSVVLNSLLKQQYPHDLVEFIFVNDHSTDSSEKIVADFAALHDNIKTYQLPPNKIGKKRAIALGVEKAANEIIVTTDADCSCPPQWLSSINETISSESCMMTVGAVKIEPKKNFFSRLQAMEFASLVGTTGATLFYLQPTMCNGANLAFRKSVFEEVGGYEGNWNIPSGDDEFLLRKIHSKYPHGIRFLPYADSVVTTQSQSSLFSFVQQRLRWAGKWRFNSSRGAKLLAIFVFVFQASYLALGVSVAAGWIPLNSFLFLMTFKFLLEFVFLYQVSIFLANRWKWIPFFVLQLIYPIYVVMIALLAQRQSFTWKDRLTKSNDRE